MRRCYMCKVLKSLNDFHKKTSRCKECQKLYRQTPQYREWQRNYRKSSDKYRDTKRRCAQKRRKQSKHKVYDAFRIRITDSLKGKHLWEIVFGYSTDDLLNHLENLFEAGMRWENYGNGSDKWNIDHIKPINSFNLSDIEELKNCWALSNLRPMWSIDNSRKSFKS